MKSWDNTLEHENKLNHKFQIKSVLHNIIDCLHKTDTNISVLIASKLSVLRRHEGMIQRVKLSS